MLLIVYLMINFLNSKNLTWIELVIFSIVFDFFIAVGKSIASHIFRMIK